MIAGPEAWDPPKCTTPPQVIAGPRSLCGAFREVILPMLELGLSAQRIYQDLVAGHGFGGSYPSASRYVARLKAQEPERVWRIECAPGKELQVDFGLGTPLVEAGGETRRTWLFRAVLSHSRKGYSEVVLRQDTETFLRVIENAIRSFGGVPRLLNFDKSVLPVCAAEDPIALLPRLCLRAVPFGTLQACNLFQTNAKTICLDHLEIRDLGGECVGFDPETWPGTNFDSKIVQFWANVPKNAQTCPGGIPVFGLDQENAELETS